MYDSNHFDKNKMLDWEQLTTAIKTDCVLAKQYFKALVKATDTYKQNADGGTVGQKTSTSLQTNLQNVATKSVTIMPR
jgi:hypothetical protein